MALEDGRVVRAAIRGRLKRERRTGSRVVIGDRVRVGDADGATPFIEQILPRRRELVRGGPGGVRAKLVAANVERLVVVAALRDPDPRRETIDRGLVIGEAAGMAAALVLNKADLVKEPDRAADLAAVYRRVGYPTLVTSAVTGAGVEELRALLCDGSSALVGPSGVGKSTLLNRVEPELRLRTGELSRKVRRGRHTTVSARLIPLKCGGLVADTPGFSEIGLWRVAADQVEQCFPELRAASGECRFRRCAHLHEPGCAVRSRLERGEIDQSRFESYRSLREEALDRPGG